MKRLLVLAAALGAAVATVPGSTAAHPPLKTFAGIVRDVPSGARVGTATGTRTRTRLFAPLARIANLPYGGGPVLHANRAHVIFWQPAGSGLTFDPGYTALIVRFLQRVAAASHSTTNVYGLSGQYKDSGGPAAYNSALGRSAYPTDPLPGNGCAEPALTGPGWIVCLTDFQLEHEIEHVVSTNHLPTTQRDVYFLVTPNGLGSCTDASSTICALGGDVSGYCGYHSVTNDGRILYAVIPFNGVAGHCQSGSPRPHGSTADPTISTISHEHNEMVTDPLGDAWIDGSGEEDGDLCLTSFGPIIGGAGGGAWNETIDGGHYYLQQEWSNFDGGCRARARPNAATFTDAGGSSTVSFTARASDHEGRIVSYAWFFGDGVRASGRTVMHRYGRPGRFRVVLRVTDSWGNWTFYARTLRMP